MIEKTTVDAVVAALEVFLSDIRRHNNLTFYQSPAVALGERAVKAFGNFSDFGVV